MGDLVFASKLVKSFKNTVALGGITMSAGRGMNIVVGPNGAGKSTLLRCIGGLYRPDSGFVRVLGMDPYIEDDARRRVSLLSDNYALYDRLSVMDNLRFFGRLYGIGDSEIRKRSKTLLEKLGAYEYSERKAAELSRGTKQKVAICRALINNPDIILLDEPTAFLDAVSAEKVHLMLEGFAKEGRSVIYATQRLNEATRFDAALFVIKNGRLSNQIRTEDLYDETLKGSMVNIRTANRVDARIAKKTPHFDSANGRTIKLRVDGYRDINDAVSYLIGEGTYVVSIDYTEPVIEGMLGG